LPRSISCTRHRSCRSGWASGVSSRCRTASDHTFVEHNTPCCVSAPAFRPSRSSPASTSSSARQRRPLTGHLDTEHPHEQRCDRSFSNERLSRREHGNDTLRRLGARSRPRPVDPGAAANAATFVYVGCTDSNEIHILQLDPQNGGLTPVEKVTIPGIVKTAGSTPMAISPDKNSCSPPRAASRWWRRASASIPPPAS